MYQKHIIGEIILSLSNNYTGIEELLSKTIPASFFITTF
jgi:hypothetical protein